MSAATSQKLLGSSPRKRLPGFFHLVSKRPRSECDGSKRANQRVESAVALCLKQCLGSVFWVKEQPHEHQDPGVPSKTLCCSHDQCDSLCLSVIG